MGLSGGRSNGTGVRVRVAERVTDVPSAIRGASAHRSVPVRCGPGGLVAQPAATADPDGALAQPREWRIVSEMTLTATTRAELPRSRLLSGLLLGSALVTAGLLADYAAIATPFVSTLIPQSAATSGPVAIAVGVWAFAILAGGALLVAGTSRLAWLLAVLRRGPDRGGPAAQALASASDEVAVLGNVPLVGGPPIPELVVGAFGAAVVHTMPPGKLIRRGARWETRTSDGWVPMDDPLETAVRDADRVRRWLSLSDVDFVVRVYAAVVVDGLTIERSTQCATITREQIPGWIAVLPRQRTLTKGRRDRLLAMAQAPSTVDADRRARSW